jgi:hypothetical protein
MRTFVYFLMLFFAPANLVAQDWNIVWQQCFGGSSYDDANDILHIPGGYFIIGNTQSSDGDVSFNHGYTDGWLIKTDTTGNMMWEKTLGGSMGKISSVSSLVMQVVTIY